MSRARNAATVALRFSAATSSLLVATKNRCGFVSRHFWLGALVKKERQVRIDHELQRELARLISRELSDPRLGFVTVTRVEVTQDLNTAKVFVSIIGDRHVAGQSMEALESAKKFLRGELGRAVKLRHTPELVFVEDRTTERAIALSKVLAESAAKAGTDAAE